MLACPLCTASMRATVLGSVELDVCTSCRAVYFDAGELRRHLKTGKALETTLHRAAMEHGAPSSAGACVKCEGAFRAMATESGDALVCGGCDGVLLSREVFDRAPQTGVLPKRLATLSRGEGVGLGDGALVGVEVGAGVLELILEVVLELFTDF